MLSTFHIVLAMKPISGNFADNALQVGIAGLNIEECRIPIMNGEVPVGSGHGSSKSSFKQVRESEGNTEWNRTPANGRWPANLILEGSEEVKAMFPESKGQQGDVRGTEPSHTGQNGIYGNYDRTTANPKRGDSGSAARFFKQIATK